MREVIEPIWPDDLDAKQASSYLNKKSIKASQTTLANWRSAGCGPSFRKDGRRVLYPKIELDSFAARRLSPLVGSTSELRAVAAMTPRERAAQTPAAE